MWYDTTQMWYKIILPILFFIYPPHMPLYYVWYVIQENKV